MSFSTFNNIGTCFYYLRENITKKALETTDNSTLSLEVRVMELQMAGDVTGLLFRRTEGNKKVSLNCGHCRPIMSKETVECTSNEVINGVLERII
jgi:hypothetical protein